MKKKHLQIFFPLIRHTLLLSNLWKYLYKCNTRDDLEKDQTWQRIRSEVIRVRAHILCARVSRERAWRTSFCARVCGLCHRRASGKSGRERGTVRRQKKYHKGGEAPWYVTRGKRPRRRGGKGGNFFLLSFWLSLSLSLTRFPFVPGFDRGSTKLLLPPAVVRSKSSASSPLSTFNRRWQLNTGRPYENYHFFYVNRTYANCSDLRLPNRCFHHLLSSFKCQFFSLLHFFISCYKQKIFRGLISRS